MLPDHGQTFIDADSPRPALIGVRSSTRPSPDGNPKRSMHRLQHAERGLGPWYLSSASKFRCTHSPLRSRPVSGHCKDC